MTCDENCSCFLCRELHGCEGRIENGKGAPENFILSKSKANVFDLTKYTFFGMVNDSKCAEAAANENGIEAKSEKAEVKHKSVIYIDKADENNNESDVQNSNAPVNEKVDEFMSLDSIQDTSVVNVVFKNTFSFATQIVNDVFTPETWSDVDSDDFPLGMEADYFNKIYSKQG